MLILFLSAIVKKGLTFKLRRHVLDWNDEYYDNDCKIRIGADALVEFVTGKLDAVKALEDGRISIDGDIEKALILSDALKAVTDKKSTEAKKNVAASKPTTSKKPVEKKTEVKKAAGKKK